MANILILGAGMMGSALAFPLADRGHDVRLVGTHLDEAIIDRARQDGFHPKLGLALPAGVKPCSHRDLAAAAEGIDAIAFGVSSAGITWACDKIAPHVRPDTPLFMITKGLVLEGGALTPLPDVVRARLPESARRSVFPAAVAGPCIAGELARRVPSCVVLTGRDAGQLARIRALIEADYYRAFPTTDVVGAEVSAALKNAYAMGIAFAAGMHERAGHAPGSVAMHNLESAIMAQAILEMQHVVVALGGEARTVAGLAGVGDLDVTTNGGRTGRFGRFLGLGLPLDQAIEKMEGATLECLEILSVLRAALTEGAVPGTGRATLPLLDHLIAVALEGHEVSPPTSRFFADELGRAGA